MQMAHALQARMLLQQLAELQLISPASVRRHLSTSFPKLRTRYDACLPQMLVRLKYRCECPTVLPGTSCCLAMPWTYLQV